MKNIFIFFVLLSSLIIAGDDLMALEIKSSAFVDSDYMPAKYTCKGENISPPLSWSGVPEGAKSFALICDDPDAPFITWDHWVIYNIPPEANGLKEAIPKDEVLPDGALQGINDFRKIGYGGPCPPPGPAHSYHFKLYALDTKLDLKPGATKKALLKAMEGHILEEALIIGEFKR